MSEIAKWGLLVAGAVVILGMIFGLVAGEIPGGLDTLVETLARLVMQLVGVIREGLYFGRGFVNLFTFPGYEWLVSLVITYLIGRWFFQLSSKIVIWIYHYIFK